MADEKPSVDSVFCAAIEIESAEERQKYLAQACGQDAELLHQVGRLLRAHYGAGRFLESPPDEVAFPPTLVQPLTEQPGTQIGAYKLLQQIGEGGFGVVYMAEQVEPLRRKVALKIIKPGMDTKQVVARFEAERQALALMDHPNIAKVLDAGSTDSGRPYFVMELVKGVPITEYCDKNNLSTQERLALFVQVCRAVQHAHQKGVIHRDLKPSNVMVTLHDGHPVPKVIDFGVSKAISQQLTEKTLFTAYGQMIGTPQYMSPEQAEMSGLDVDTRSDVYSLGVLLYELLTGTTPLDRKRLCTLAYVEMQRVIREEDPPSPSARLSTLGGELTVVAKHRSTDARRLTQLLRGDLDWIVMKALSKERGRRYESASSFATDVERHLANETIEARPPSASYQIARFVRRHKGPAIAAAVVLLTLLLGIAGTTTGLVMATKAKNREREENQQKERLLVDKGRLLVENEVALDESERLAHELSVLLDKVSEGAARTALQSAHGLVVQNRPQESLLWFHRALELLPADEMALEREIRTAMGAVAEKLPQPLFVVAPEAGQIFSKSEVSRDGERILVLVETDAPGEAQAIEVRVIDTRDGTDVSRIAVDPKTYWVGFSGDGRTVLTVDPAAVRRYRAESGRLQGPAYDLAEALKQHTFTRQLPAETLESLEGMAESTEELGGDRILARIAAVNPTGRSALVRFYAVGDGSSRLLPRGLLDLESGGIEFFSDSLGGPDSIRWTTFALDGQRLIAAVRPRGAVTTTQLFAWDLAAGQLQEAWQQTVPYHPFLSQWSTNGDDRVLLRTRERTSETTTTLRIFDLEAGELLPAELAEFEVSSHTIDAALSPSGRKVAVLTSPDPRSTEITIWDIAEDRSRSIPLSRMFSAGSQDRQQGHVAFGASENTVLTWDHDLLVCWRLAPEPTKRAYLGPRESLQSLTYLGTGDELVAIAPSGPLGIRSGRGRPAHLNEIVRYDTTQRQPLGRRLPIVAELAAISPDGKTLVTALGRSLQRWDMATMSKSGQSFGVSEESKDFSHLEFADGGRVLVSRRARNERTGPDEVRRVAYFMIGVGMPDHGDQGLAVLSVLPGTPAAVAGLQADDRILRSGEEPIQSMAELREVVERGSGDSIELTFLRDGKEHTQRIKPMPRTPENVRSQVAKAFGEVRLWNLETGRELGELAIPLEGEQTFSSAAVAPDGRSVVTVGRFGQRAELRKFNAESGRPVAPSVKYPRPIRQIHYGPRGQVLATIDTRSEVQLWNAYDLTRVGSRIRPAGTVNTVSFKPDGGALLVASDTDAGPRLSLWDTSTGNRLTPPMELPGRATELLGTDQLAFSPDGTRVAIDARYRSVWVHVLPPNWRERGTESTDRVGALTGCTLTEQGDVEPLEAAQWARRIARVTFPQSTDESDEDEDLMAAWRQTESYSLLRRAETDEELLAVLDPLIEEEPDFWPARRTRVSVLLHQGRFDEARKDVEAAGENRLEFLNVARYSLGWRAERLLSPGSGRDQTVEETSRELSSQCDLILAIEPENPTALLLRTLALALGERDAEAEEALQTAVKAGPEELVVENLWSIVQGIRADRFERYSPSRFRVLVKRSQWLLDRLIEMRPDDWRFLVKRAEFALGDERMDDALTDIDQAVELGPAEKIASEITFTRSSVPRPGELPLEQLREETRLYKKLLELDPNNEAARKQLGDLHGRLGEWDEAAQQYSRLDGLGDESFAFTYRLAPLLVKTGQAERCRDLFQERIHWAVPLADAFPHKDYQPHIQNLQTSLEKPNLSDSDRVRYQSSLGYVCLRSGRHAEAIEWLEKLLESEAINKNFRIRGLTLLAIAHHENGTDTNAQKAQELLAEAEQLYTENAPQFGVEDGGTNWCDWLICKLLLEEAKEKIGSAEEPNEVTFTGLGGESRKARKAALHLSMISILWPL